MTILLFPKTTIKLTDFNTTKYNHAVADFVVEDVKPKCETIFLPMPDPREKTTFENPNDDNPRRQKRKVKQWLGKS